jgi:hypothetical protein
MFCQKLRLVKRHFTTFNLDSLKRGSCRAIEGPKHALEAIKSHVDPESDAGTKVPAYLFLGGDVLWRLEVAAAFKGSGHGDFVGVLDVGTGGDSSGDAGDAEAGGDAVDFGGEEGGGGFAFGGR